MHRVSLHLRRLLLGFSLAGCAAAATLQAQDTVGVEPGLNAALVRLYEKHQAFTAQLEVRMVDARGKETLNAPMKFSMLEGRMRGDLDLTRLKSEDLPALAATAAKSVGMTEVITLVRPDKQETYLLYPAFQACIVAPLDPEDVAALEKPATIEKTLLGRETLDSHPCVKSKVVVTQADGRRHEATVWEATDMKEFPLRVQTVVDGDTLTLQFRQVKLQAPAARVFELPTGTAKYDDPQALTQAVMKKLIKEAVGVK